MKNLSRCSSLWILLLVISLFSCQSGNNEESAQDDGGVMNKALMSEQPSAERTYRVQNENSSSDGDVKSEEILPGDKIIKTANIGLRLENYEKDKHRIYSAIKANGGYISEENEQRETYRISNDLTIRVPNKDFDKLIENLTTGEGVRNVDYKRIRAEDVGEEYTDIEARLRSKKAVEEQYYEILKQAKSIPDILAVKEQIRRLREEIDAHLGRLKYLQDRISYSTVNLNVYEEFETSPIDRPGFWNKLKNALQGGWHGALGFIIGMVNLWPMWIGLIVLIVLIRRVRRKWRQRKSKA